MPERVAVARCCLRRRSVAHDDHLELANVGIGRRRMDAAVACDPAQDEPPHFEVFQQRFERRFVERRMLRFQDEIIVALGRDAQKEVARGLAFTRARCEYRPAIRSPVAEVVGAVEDRRARGRRARRAPVDPGPDAARLSQERRGAFEVESVDHIDDEKRRTRHRQASFSWTRLPSTATRGALGAGRPSREGPGKLLVRAQRFGHAQVLFERGKGLLCERLEIGVFTR